MLEIADYNLNLDKQRDLSRNRVITLDNGSKVIIRCKDPYGHWYITYDRSQPPAHLQGSYTTFDEAFKALENYIRVETSKKVVEVDKGFVKLTEKDLKKV